MPQGDKSSYTDKQKRKAEHIEQGYEHRGVGKGEADLLVPTGDGVREPQNRRVVIVLN